ncbi:MAG: ribosome recycling factor [Chlamydiia bacterium]|nr:ribosome recycling factor [Chlamydiia bacterium]
MGIKDDTKKKMEASIEHLRHELQNIRTGRANPGMLNTVMVEVYGSPMRLRDVANITVPEPRQLLVTPYDAGNTNAIAKAIDAANLGVRAIADGKTVRVNMPEMDEKQRKEMVKLCQRRCEETKVSIRGVRRDSNELARKQKADGTMPEDVANKLEKDIQTLTDDYCKQAEDVTKAKEVEVMEV